VKTCQHLKWVNTGGGAINT